jgi:hypothetical protein
VIATWQYVAIGALVVVVLTVLQYRSRHTEVRDDAFFRTLEATVGRALAAQHFVLTRKVHMPKSFGHRYWYFERSLRAVQVFWDGKERQISAELQERESQTPVRKQIASFGIALGSPPDDYGRVLDGLVEAIDAAVRTDGSSSSSQQ